MAHILIGRYRALTEAEAIVHDLVAQGFARSQMTLATPYAVAPASAPLGLQVWSALEGAQELEVVDLDLTQACLDAQVTAKRVVPSGST